MNPYMFLKIPNLLADAHRLKQIDTDNKKIIQRINIINRTKVNSRELFTLILRKL